MKEAYPKKKTKKNFDNFVFQYTWKRPYELASNPSIYVDGTSRKDVIQGILGDCWLLSTCAAVAKREDLLHRVVPPDQVGGDSTN